MSRRTYWKNQLPAVIFQLLCMLMLSVFLLVVGNSADSILLIDLVWVLLCTAAMICRYRRRKRDLDRLLKMQEQLEEKYLIPELMPLPERADDQVYYFLLKDAEKGMLEQIEGSRRERAEYKEYIEQWIHEVKTPITAMKLLCENNLYPFTRDLLAELEKVTRFTEQALYYARSEQVWKDYSVREISLSDVVHSAVADNRYLLTRSKAVVEVAEFDDMVFSDEKWVRFILNQLIVNAVKYSKGNPVIRIYTKRGEEAVHLRIEDTGIGIPAQDLPRVFDKGFTGENGRVRQNATGIGLYLCKRLCDKLDIGLSVTSDTNGTMIDLSFRINDFIRQVQG
ncbi:MAG: HAMP domain-containing histidine kinase [Lachnospiraceae bacterium]|nr:HAMP domain-containing histidine kinase [Lachnospiraceae bacterium]